MPIPVPMAFHSFGNGSVRSLMTMRCMGLKGVVLHSAEEGDKALASGYLDGRGHVDAYSGVSTPSPYLRPKVFTANTSGLDLGLSAEHLDGPKMHHKWVCSSFCVRVVSGWVLHRSDVGDLRPDPVV